MKIGTSLSRCVVDLYEKTVDMVDVMVVVSRTRFDPEDDAQWKGIWEGYVQGGWSSAEWSGFADKEAEFRAICVTLKTSGKLHQPRLFGARPPRAIYPWYETILAPKELEQNPSVKDAWDQYQILTGLSK